MLTLAQLQLIRRIELFSHSPFMPSILDEKGAEKNFYIVSNDEYKDWLSIPKCKISHLSHIQVQTLYPDNFKEKHKDYLTETNKLPAFSSGVSVTPPL